MFKIDFIKSGWFLDVWFLGTYRGLGYGSQHGHGLYLQEYIIIVQYMDRIHASYMHMFKKAYVIDVIDHNLIKVGNYKSIY